MEKSKYNEQAEQFLKDTDTKFNAKFIKHDVHFEGDKEERDIYKITLTRGSRVYEFDFGQSIACSGKYRVHGIGNNQLDNMRDKEFVKAFRNGQRLFNAIPILKITHSVYGGKLVKNRDFTENKEFAEPAAYDVLACLDVIDGDFEEFCGNFGYDTDSIKSSKIFKAIEKQSEQLKMLFSDSEIEKLQNIQ